MEVVQCSTDREAINMGIWLHETLSLLAHWRVRLPLMTTSGHWRAIIGCLGCAACIIHKSSATGSQHVTFELTIGLVALVTIQQHLHNLAVTLGPS